MNPMKCQVYFGNMDIGTKNEILDLTTFFEGPLPLRYLGIPLTRWL